MCEYSLADLISLALETTHMGCMVHDYVVVSDDAQRAWACWVDEDYEHEEHVLCFIDINYVDGVYESIDVWGTGPGGGRGAFYCSLPL